MGEWELISLELTKFVILSLSLFKNHFGSYDQLNYSLSS